MCVVALSKQIQICCRIKLIIVETVCGGELFNSGQVDNWQSHLDGRIASGCAIFSSGELPATSSPLELPPHDQLFETLIYGAHSVYVVPLDYGSHLKCATKTNSSSVYAAIQHDIWEELRINIRLLCSSLYNFAKKAVNNTRSKRHVAYWKSTMASPRTRRVLSDLKPKDENNVIIIKGVLVI